ncbi:MAG TPA: geranylgeranylglycerol-phosphate geranylgeranyltransferase [Chitinophagaceae bacterium]|nr:geranylgeranylglycerol-phosphate geranylgeranyltransferase [Chitinophagaceae bacterium]
MRLFAAFLKMIRLPNLFFIALTQVLFYGCIQRPVLERAGGEAAFDPVSFVLLVAASVLIAAAGYIINDYFDINIDQVNKPRDNVVDTIVSRRWAMLWHMILSGAGVAASFWVFLRTGLWYVAVVNFLCVILLFLYSASLKKKLLSGNILISLLTAWVILVLCFSQWDLQHPAPDTALQQADHKIVRLGFLYAAFAFVISLIREAIKDMEDLEGDARYGCRTMPIRWGLTATKVYVAVWLVVLVAVVVTAQVYVMQFRWWWPNLYSTLVIVVPLVFLFLRLFRASGSAAFHSLSQLTKWVMLAGILSMAFFRFYL